MDKKIFKLEELKFRVELYLPYIIPEEFHESTYKTIKCSDIGKGDKSKFTTTLSGFKLSENQILYNLALPEKIKESRSPKHRAITKNTLRYLEKNTIKCFEGEEVEINKLEWLATTDYKKALNILSEVEPDDITGIRREFKVPSKHMENLQGITEPTIHYGKTSYKGYYSLQKLIFIADSSKEKYELYVRGEVKNMFLADPPKEKYELYVGEWVEKGKPTKIISTPSKIEFC